jgi:tRNA pseudouridine32 synthase/23S rRNA pseudouridine746 synthase/23S rRNA pseudouridine1911/1915/1917 synthase
MKYIASTNLLLFEALVALAPEASKTTLRSWLKEGRVTVDGHVVKLPNATVYPNQEVALQPRPRYIEGNLRIVYEDSDIIVVDKPSGLLSVATAYEKDETVHKILKRYFSPKEIFVVHRIDQDTSGILLFALSERAYEALKLDFEKHTIERAYTAVVEGRVDPSVGTWESYLYEDGNYVVHSSRDPQRGRLAITHYYVVAMTNQRSLLALRLETGRKNQIRVHCQDAGHSVVGDKKYGSKASPLKRLCLHAHLLAFKHPVTNRDMRFESPVPEAFYDLVK